MDTIIKLVWYDKKTEYMVNKKVITHLFSEPELRLLLGEKEELYACYSLTTQEQIDYIQKRLGMKFSDEYDYLIEFCGDWTLDLRDAIWIPAPASEFTNKDPIDRLEAEKAFLSKDPEKILDALIRVTFFDPEPFYIQQKCIECLKIDNIDLQREVLICLGHLARMHGKVNLAIITPLLDQLKENKELKENVEEALSEFEDYLTVKRQSDIDEQDD